MKVKNMKCRTQRIVLAALGTFIALTLFFYSAFTHFYTIQLQEKFQDKKFQTNVILDGIQHFVDLNHDWDTREEYRKILLGFVTALDSHNRGGVYAELFDENFNSLSKRTPLVKEDPFDPRNYIPLLTELYNNERGESIVYFRPKTRDSDIKSHNVLLYFRWIPTGDNNNKLLIVVGVSPYSLDVKSEAWIVLGVIGVIILSVGCLIYALFLCRR